MISEGNFKSIDPSVVPRVVTACRRLTAAYRKGKPVCIYNISRSIYLNGNQKTSRPSNQSDLCVRAQLALPDGLWVSVFSSMRDHGEFFGTNYRSQRLVGFSGRCGTAIFRGLITDIAPGSLLRCRIFIFLWYWWGISAELITSRRDVIEFEHCERKTWSPLCKFVFQPLQNLFFDTWTLKTNRYYSKIKKKITILLFK